MWKKGDNCENEVIENLFMHTHLNIAEPYEFLVCAKIQLVLRAIFSPEAALKGLDLPSPY